MAGSALASIEFLEAHPERVTQLRENARYFRDQLLGLGFKPLAGETPIIPVILGETSAAIRMSNLLLDEGVFVTGFGFPVVPQGQARVRCQVSAAHTRADLDEALAAFKKVGTDPGPYLSHLRRLATPASPCKSVRGSHPVHPPPSRSQSARANRGQPLGV